MSVLSFIILFFIFLFLFFLFCSCLVWPASPRCSTPQLVTSPQTHHHLHPSQLFNILAIIFVQSAEYPYYAVKGYIPFDALPTAAIVFTTISLVLLICIPRLQTSIIWLRNEWFILCCLIVVYCYALVYFIGATVQCHDEAPPSYGCPRQRNALVSLN